MRTLSFDEVGSVSGGDGIGSININLQQVTVGLGIIALSVAVVASGGIAAVPAAAAASTFLGAAGVAGALGGGVVIGSSVHATAAAPSKDDKSGGS